MSKTLTRFSEDAERPRLCKAAKLFLGLLCSSSFFLGNLRVSGKLNKGISRKPLALLLSWLLARCDAHIPPPLPTTSFLWIFICLKRCISFKNSVICFYNV
uniref:Uncharacterized protein n=1 Tax=Opuntia streptacantha TaxID=393608 RepID=A0A7C9E6X1_OPUST